jgi:hypothetical protein
MNLVKLGAGVQHRPLNIEDATMDPAETTAEAIYWRGQFIHRHSAIEFALSELITRALLLPAYVELPELSFVWNKRVALLNAMLEIEGPLRPFRDHLLAPINQIKALEHYRHLMVHGLMVAERPVMSDQVIAFRMYGWPEKGKLGLISLSLPMAQLIDLVGSIAPFSADFTGLVAELSAAIPLPFLSAEPQQALA